MIGVGVQSGLLGNLGVVARLEATMTDYDDVKSLPTSLKLKRSLI